jgi:hypothetical protein
LGVAEKDAVRLLLPGLQQPDVGGSFSHWQRWFRRYTRSRSKLAKSKLKLLSPPNTCIGAQRGRIKTFSLNISMFAQMFNPEHLFDAFYRVKVDKPRLRYISFPDFPCVVSTSVIFYQVIAYDNTLTTIIIGSQKNACQIKKQGEIYISVS